MRKMEILYDPYTEQDLHSGNIPQELEMIIGLAHCIQNMCVGNGKNWDRACPKYLRGLLDKDATVRAFSKATRLLAIVTRNPMYIATATIRSFESRHIENSFYEVTVNLNRGGKAMTGEIRTTHQLYALALSI